MKKIICKILGHDRAISFAPNKESPSGYNYFWHCLRCREIFEEGHAEI